MARSLTPQSAQRSLIWASTSWLPASATSTACIPADWAGLSFERLGEIKAQTGDLPLVLHGGTGIPEDQIKKAISLGISKINVNTDLQLVFAKGVREYIEAGKDQQGKGFDPRKLLKPGRDNIVARTKELMEEFGSVNKA